MQPAVDCSNWSALVNWTSHPCGSPGRGTQLTDVQSLDEGEDSQERKKNFDEIYEKAVWASGESKSGPGSDIFRTVDIKKILDKVFYHLKIVLKKDKIRFLDSSCGDMNWMPGYLRGREENDILYTGYDIVQSNIDSHIETFANETWQFEQHDIVMDTVDSQYDLILSRHTMIHLKFRDIVRVFDNFINSGSRYLLMTQHANLENNDLQTTDAHTGRFRGVNFFKSPFSLPEPICIARDTVEPGADTFVMLYDLRSLVQ